MRILGDENSLLGSLLVLFCQNLLRMVVLKRFHLFTPTSLHSMLIYLLYQLRTKPGLHGKL